MLTVVVFSIFLLVTALGKSQESVPDDNANDLDFLLNPVSENQVPLYAVLRYLKAGKGSGSGKGITSGTRSSGDDEEADEEDDSEGGFTRNEKIVFLSIVGVLAILIIWRMIWGCFHKDEPVQDEEADKKV